MLPRQEASKIVVVNDNMKDKRLLFIPLVLSVFGCKFNQKNANRCIFACILCKKRNPAGFFKVVLVLLSAGLNRLLAACFRGCIKTRPVRSLVPALA